MTDKANWLDVDLNSLSVGATVAYNNYKALYRQAKQAREEFEETVRAANPVAEGKRLVFGYNFGKLSIAVVADDKPRKQAKPKQSLADFLANQR